MNFAASPFRPARRRMKLGGTMPFHHHGCSAQETLSLIAQQRARMRLFLVKDGTCRRHKLGRLVVVHGGLDIRMSGKGLNAFKAGSTACELCETAMAKPVRRNVASGDDKGRPFLDESIQPVPRDGASSVAEVFKDRILRTRRGVTPQFFKRRLGFLRKIHPPCLAAFTQHVKIPAPLPVDHIHPFERYRFFGAQSRHEQDPEKDNITKRCAYFLHAGEKALQFITPEAM